MFSTVQDFLYIWAQEFEGTQKVLKHVTTQSLTQAVVPGGRTLGRLAWHLTVTIPEMMNRTGLEIGDPDPEAPIPATAKEIFNAYNKAAEELIEQVRAKWTDADLEKEDNMYGEQWKRKITLTSLVFHQIHHRAQIEVLMRQAGLRVPGLYGPSKEEWVGMGMTPQE